MAKPDDRSDNVEKLQEMIDNTMGNIRESRDYLKAHGSEMNAAEKENLEAKNSRREESIEGYRAEIKDEANQNQLQ
ncbi:small acid-soluble spore protein Tlp [Brevibacillus ginsengisoli]|uniref:small acid-soluble spore protein Tlp n=1 Tax=Brevibacillus ginsengisoli TaxID=363854 RepID=UPI003CF676FF